MDTTRPENIEIVAFDRPWNDDIAVLVRGDDRSGGILRTIAAAGMEFVEIPVGGQMPTATAISRQAAQRLIDSLWTCGLRPTQGRQSEGVTLAQARHLDDMRSIAFAKLKIERPNTN